MVEFLIETVVIIMWGAVLAIHMRRLLRLTAIEIGRPHRLRGRLAKIWWWLGREEYWRGVQMDGLRCVQLTLMIFLAAWGIFS